MRLLTSRKIDIDQTNEAYVQIVKSEAKYPSVIDMAKAKMT